MILINKKNKATSMAEHFHFKHNLCKQNNLTRNHLENIKNNMKYRGNIKACTQQSNLNGEIN